LLIGIIYEKRRGDAFSKSNWDAVIFSVQIHSRNIRKIGGREVKEEFKQNALIRQG